MESNAHFKEENIRFKTFFKKIFKKKKKMLRESGKKQRGHKFSVDPPPIWSHREPGTI